MNRRDTTRPAIIDLARGLRDLQQQAAREYRPVVDDILRTGSRDARHVEETEAAIREAIAFHIEGMQEDGLPVPSASSQVEYVEIAA